MTTIKLKNGYFVEVDEMNSTLKQKFTGKKKDGTEKESEKVIGYFKKPVDAIERFIKLNRLDEMEGVELSVGEYLKALKKADTDVLQWLKENLKGE